MMKVGCLLQKSTIIVIMFCSTVLLIGCWDRREIEERAMILAISIDSAPAEAEEKEEQVNHMKGKFPKPERDMIEISAQIALPGKLALGPGQGGGEGEGSSETVWPLHAVGHTINDAFMNLQQQISNKIFLGHLRVVVVSEEVAKKGLDNINDYFSRNSEIRTTTWMIVCKGKAADFISLSPKLSRLPALYLLASMEDATRMGQFPYKVVGLFWRDIKMQGQEGFLPYVKRKHESFEISGIAYFKEDKLVGTTKPLEIASYMAIKGVNPGGYRGFVSLSEQPGQDIVNVYVTNRKSDMKFKIIDDMPHVQVNLFLEFNLEEKTSEHIEINMENIKRIEQNFNEGSAKMAVDLIKKTQKDGADIFGFGEAIRAQYPKYWSQHIGHKEKWQETYKNIQVDVSVIGKFRRTGMKSR